MAQNKNIFIKIQVSDKKAKESLDSTGKSVDKLSQLNKKLAFEESEKGKAVALANEKLKNQQKINRQLAKAKLDLNSETKKETAGQRLLAKAKEKLNFIRSKEALELERVNAQIRIQNDVNKSLISSEMGLATSKASVNAQGKAFKTQAGLNNAILLETGRLASDASYGFTAIANNLSQLVSLGGSFIATTGSLGSALGELKKSLFGVGGILLGVQVLIGLFQDKRVLDFIKSIGGLNGNLKTLSDLTKDASKNAESLIGNFKIYTRILSNANESEEQRALALKKLNEEYPDFNASVLEEITNTKEATRVQNLYIESLRRRALSQAAEDKFREISGKIVEIELQKEIDKTVERDKFLERSGRAIVKQELSNGQAIMVSQEEKSQAYVDAVAKIDKASKDELKSENDKLDFLIDLIDITEKNKNKITKDAAEFQTKIFEAKYTDFEKIEQRYRERSQKSELRTNEEILAQTQQNEMAKIDIMEEAFIRKQQLRLADYKDQLAQDVKSKNITQEEADVLAADADAEYLKSVEDAAEKRKSLEVEVLNFISSLRTLQIRKDANIAEQQNDKRLELLRKFRLDSADILKLGFGDEEDYYTAREDAIGKDIEQQKRVVDAYEEGSLLKAQAQVELFNLEDNLRQNSLQKEIAAINEKKRVNMAYVSYAMGIGQIMSELAGENEALQKAALVIEKGAAIGSIVVDAHSSIAQSRANTAVANTAAMALPVPFSTIKIAKNEAMFAKEALMTKISAGIGIASILATTISSFQKPSAPSSSGGGGVDVKAPAFNVVGASPTNQLAQTVSNNTPQILPVVFDSDLSDGLEPIDPLLGSDSGGVRSVG